jgi:hypothetical protein
MPQQGNIFPRNATTRNATTRKNFSKERHNKESHSKENFFQGMPFPRNFNFYYKSLRIVGKYEKYIQLYQKQHFLLPSQTKPGIELELLKIN